MTKRATIGQQVRLIFPPTLAGKTGMIIKETITYPHEWSEPGRVLYSITLDEPIFRGRITQDLISAPPHWFEITTAFSAAVVTTHQAA